MSEKYVLYLLKNVCIVRQLSYLQLMCLDQDVKSVADRHDILSVSVAVAARRGSKKHPCNYRQPGDGDARCC